MKVENALGFPKTYYGLHMNQGVAEYRPRGKDPYRVLIGEECIRKMNPTFSGRPLFIGHHPDADPSNVKDADGIVVDSFFNKADGMHWAKFMVFTQEAEDAIQNGMTLSNCYDAGPFGAGGLANGVQYDKEALGGVFHHMALVPDPRYENSLVLAPDAFRQYNVDKEAQLLRLANSKKGEKPVKPKFNFWKREKIENSADFETTVVQLPKSGKEVTLEKLINDMDEAAMMEDQPMNANGDHMVDCGPHGKMTVNALVEKHMKAMNELSEFKAKTATGEEGDVTKAKKTDEMTKEEVESGGKGKMANEAKEKEEKEKKEKMENEAKEEKEKKEKMENSLFFTDLANAPLEKFQNENEGTVDLAMDQVSRGAARYGSAALKH